MSNILSAFYDRSVLDIAISLCRYFFPVWIGYYFMRKLLPNRLNAFSLIAISLVYTLWFNLRTPALYGTVFHFWMNIFVNAWTYFVLLFLFKGELWKRLIIYWFFDTIKVMCEASAFAPILMYQSYHGYNDRWSDMMAVIESSTMLKIFYMLVFCSVLLLLGSLSVKIWRKLLLQKFQPFYLLLIALPIGQGYSLALVIHPGMGSLLTGALMGIGLDVDASYSIHSLLGILICIVSDIAIFFYAIALEKKAFLDKELSETRRQMEMEQVKYRDIERQSEELTKIRHDFNNQLASIARMVRSGEGDAARDLSDSLSRLINKPNNSSNSNETGEFLP